MPRSTDYRVTSELFADAAGVAERRALLAADLEKAQVELQEADAALAQKISVLR